jgi:hypothetical protein
MPIGLPECQCVGFVGGLDFGNERNENRDNVSILAVMVPGDACDGFSHYRRTDISAWTSISTQSVTSVTLLIERPILLAFQTSHD